MDNVAKSCDHITPVAYLRGPGFTSFAARQEREAHQLAAEAFAVYRMRADALRPAFNLGRVPASSAPCASDAS